MLLPIARSLAAMSAAITSAVLEDDFGFRDDDVAQVLLDHAAPVLCRNAAIIHAIRGFSALFLPSPP